MNAGDRPLRLRIRVPPPVLLIVGSDAAARVEAEVRAVLDDFGLPLPVRVTVEALDDRSSAPSATAVDRHGAAAPIEVLADDRSLAFPEDELPRTVAYVRGVPSIGPVEAATLDPAAWAETATWPADALTEVLTLVSRAAVVGRLGDVLAEHPLREVLELGAPVSPWDSATDPAAVEEALSGSPGYFELSVHPDYLRHLSTADETGERFPFMWDGLFVELGLWPPPVRLRLDASLRPRGFRFRVRHVTATPWIGLDDDTVLVNDSAERLGLQGIDAVPTINPATRQPAALTSVGNRAALEEHGLTTWDAWGYLVLVCAHTVRENAWRFMTNAVADGLLMSCGRAFPAVETAVRTVVPPHLFTRVLREMLLDQDSVRDLRAVAEAVVRAVSAPELRTADPVTVVRNRLADAITAKKARGTGTLVVYLLDPAFESADLGQWAQAEDLCDAVARELEYLPSTAWRPAILTRDHLRRSVRRAVRHRFPSLMVLGYGDVAPTCNIQPVARISPG